MIRVAERVRAALARGDAVVALESTVLTHGLAHPANLELGRRLEAAVSEEGAVPATVGVVDGTLVVGVDDDELARLAGGGAEKATTWNLAGLAAKGADAGTTVAATLHAAAATGVGVFATGGIGGVHDAPFDESADLAALARTRVVTVCSGPKSVLDAAATLERLETAGVTVVGWRSDRLAGFLSPTTDLPVPVRADTVDELAAIARAHAALGLPGGVLVSRPQEDGIPEPRVRAWIDEAIRAAAAQGVRGKDVTPFLLADLAERSGGETVEVNLRLLEGNARLAARLARALAAPTPGARTRSTPAAAGVDHPHAARPQTDRTALTTVNGSPP